MSNFDTFAQTLYQDQQQGKRDVSHRLQANTTLGSLDLKEVLRDRMQLEDGLHILDVGCGPAHHLAFFNTHHALNCHGVDPYAVTPQHTGIHFQSAPADALPFDDDTFDRAMCNYTLYYVDEWEMALTEMCRVTRPSGHIVLTCPGLGNNSQFYGLHRQLFGEISAIDKQALGFLERHVEPWLQAQHLPVTAETLENTIIYPTPDDLVRYYCSTSLFRITSKDHDPERMEAAIRQAIAPQYEQGHAFQITKHIRLVRFAPGT